MESNLEVYSVWVGGGEVNPFYVTKEQAERIADNYKEQGYDDVVIEKIETCDICSIELDEFSVTTIYDEKLCAGCDSKRLMDEQ